jgi:hypothetical protein
VLPQLSPTFCVIQSATVEFRKIGPSARRVAAQRKMNLSSAKKRCQALVEQACIRKLYLHQEGKMFSMSKRSFGFAAVALAALGVALAAPSAEAGVRIGVGIGVVAPPVVVAPAPVVVAPAYPAYPAYVAPPVVYGAPVGVGVAVGGFWGFDRFGRRVWHRR